MTRAERRKGEPLRQKTRRMQVESVRGKTQCTNLMYQIQHFKNNTIFKKATRAADHDLQAKQTCKKHRTTAIFRCLYKSRTYHVTKHEEWLHQKLSAPLQAMYRVCTPSNLVFYVTVSP